MTQPSTDSAARWVQGDIEPSAVLRGGMVRFRVETPGGYRQDSEAMAALIVEALNAVDERDRLREALVWMTGADDFAPGGKARKGFLKLVKPLLDEMSAALAQSEEAPA